MSPDQINEKHGASYKCHACGATTGLRWFGGTSCPVCNNPECAAVLSAEIHADIEADEAAIEVRAIAGLQVRRGQTILAPRPDRDHSRARFR